MDRDFIRFHSRTVDLGPGEKGIEDKTFTIRSRSLFDLDFDFDIDPKIMTRQKMFLRLGETTPNSPKILSFSKTQIMGPKIFRSRYTVSGRNEARRFRIGPTVPLEIVSTSTLQTQKV